MPVCVATSASLMPLETISAAEPPPTPIALKVSSIPPNGTQQSEEGSAETTMHVQERDPAIHVS